MTWQTHPIKEGTRVVALVSALRGLNKTFVPASEEGLEPVYFETEGGPELLSRIAGCAADDLSITGQVPSAEMDLMEWVELAESADSWLPAGVSLGVNVAFALPEANLTAAAADSITLRMYNGTCTLFFAVDSSAGECIRNAQQQGQASAESEINARIANVLENLIAELDLPLRLERNGASYFLHGGINRLLVPESNPRNFRVDWPGVSVRDRLARVKAWLEHHAGQIFYFQWDTAYMLHKPGKYSEHDAQATAALLRAVQGSPLPVNQVDVHGKLKNGDITGLMILQACHALDQTERWLLGTWLAEPKLKVPIELEVGRQGARLRLKTKKPIDPQPLSAALGIEFHAAETTKPSPKAAKAVLPPLAPIVGAMPLQVCFTSDAIGDFPPGTTGALACTIDARLHDFNGNNDQPSFLQSRLRWRDASGCEWISEGVCDGSAVRDALSDEGLLLWDEQALPPEWRAVFQGCLAVGLRPLWDDRDHVQLNLGKNRWDIPIKYQQPCLDIALLRKETHDVALIRVSSLTDEAGKTIPPFVLAIDAADLLLHNDLVLEGTNWSFRNTPLHWSRA